MRVRKWVVLGGVTAAMGLMAAGCGEKESGSAPAPTAEATAEAAATDAGREDGSNQQEDKSEQMTNMKDAFKDDFTVGVCVSMATANDDEEMKFVTDHFNSITMENDMKPESLLDWEASEKSADGMPEIRTEHLGRVLKIAQDKGIKLRGHTLVWHNQTPEWFFSKDFEPSKGYADKATMKKRMEAYIQKVLTYCKENYPGVVYAWDVANEVMSDEGGFRTKSGWYETYGDESYIMDAFTFARKYAEPETKLFLNDYNEYIYKKRDQLLELLKKLREQGVVDGMGLQSHWDMEFPSINMLEEALEEYGKIEGLELQLTEIDMHNTDDSEEGLQKQAERYKEFFEAILRADRTGKANVTNVTFWGLKDDVTWLTSFKGETSYPLLFDEDHKEKPCFTSILEAAGEEYQ